jgi:hypothetical protein
MMTYAFPGEALDRPADPETGEAQTSWLFLQRIETVWSNICVVGLTCESANGIGLSIYRDFRFRANGADDGCTCHKIVEGDTGSVRLKTPGTFDKTISEDKLASICAPVNTSIKAGVANKPIGFWALLLLCWNDSQVSNAGKMLCGHKKILR